MPRLWTLGVGKSASAHIIQSAAILYADSGYRCVSRTMYPPIILIDAIASTMLTNVERMDLRFSVL